MKISTPRFHLQIFALILLPLTLLVTSAARAESIDYIAEHLLEAPMDARYLAFPQLPDEMSQTEARMQLGYAHVGGGNLQNDIPMLGLQYFYPLNDSWSLLGGAFWDEYRFSGNRSRDVAEPIYGDTPSLPASFNVNITDVSGSGNHYGVSLAANRNFNMRWNLQTGLALERLDINRFRVSFDTMDLPNNFSGQLNYKGVYNMVTPYVAFEWRPDFTNRYITSTLHGIYAMPLPRVGVKGEVSGPGFDVSGSTSSAGHGKHIPDQFIGVGFTLEHKPTGIRADLGALLYTRICEPVAHKGIENPITLSVSFPLG